MRRSALASLLAVLLLSALALQAQQGPRELSLDGSWQMGLNRTYDKTATVPGLPQDPSKATPGTLWYKRSVELPAGDWSQATITLKGARFHPEVFVDGKSIGSSEGGMAPIQLPLTGATVAPGHTIVIEIALKSMNEMTPQDASTVPGADLWRTNISSGLWDDVTLHFAGQTRITGLVPWTNFERRTLAVHWKTDHAAPAETIRAEIVDASGTVLATATRPAAGNRGVVDLSLPATLQPWTPSHPHLYRLRMAVLEKTQVEDATEISWALKSFETRDKRFYLNGEPIEMLGGTVVWERFLRTPGAADVAFDPAWFQQNITGRLKSYGANTLRWHLGLPPERMLDLCDREGLMVQMEWPFFHGISASVPSMKLQWASWLDVAMRHPSVMIVHAWNEVGDPRSISAGWEALNSALADLPPLVVAHRDTVHVHKYWWSLFENLGLYYDDVRQFDKTAMVDEFGGNYLDWNGDYGGYPATKESFLRFLGRDNTRAERLEFHAESNARVAEYWRRIGAPGILPFCALGGPQDGSSWFIGDIHHPQPMPVWDALAAAFSPISVSLDVWDRNYTPGQHISLPLFLFNDTSAPARLEVQVRVVDPVTGRILQNVPLKTTLPAHTHGQHPVELQLPQSVGNLRLEAVLLNPPAEDKHPVVSSWDIRTLAPALPEALKTARIALAGDEPELRLLLKQNGLEPVALDDPSATLIAGSSATWKALADSGARRAQLSAAVQRGVSVVLLDVGPRDLGEGYRKQSLGSLEGAPVVRTPYVQNADLFDGVKLVFRQLAEPESHIQPAAANRSLWNGLPIPATWIWNGLRGGLIAPAADMEVSGLSQAGMIAQWKQHGAGEAEIRSGQPYFAYEFSGYYAFSHIHADTPTRDALRARVRLLAEDAPALKDSIDPNGPIAETDLAAAYKGASGAAAYSLTPLSTCGKNLTRTEIVSLSFGPGKGTLILSQALTAGRLARGSAEPGGYGVRYDPAAEQFTLNMLAQALKR